MIKGRSQTMRHASRTHRVALDWLFDRINLDPKVQIKYVESKNQLADIITKGSFTRDGWHNLLHLFNIMTNTTFTRSHFSNAHPFPSAGEQSECRQDLRKSVRLDRRRWKRKNVVSFRDKVYLYKIIRVTQKSPGSTRHFEVRTWEERNTKSGWYSIQRASGNREYGHGSEDFGGLSETHASGNREVQAKSRSKHEGPTQARWKQLGYIDQLRENAHVYMDKIYGLHRCRQHCPWTRLTKRIWNYSRLLNLRASKACSGLQEWSSKEIQKLRMYLPQMLRVHFGEQPVLLTEQAIRWTKARVYVYSNSVLCLGKQHGPEDAVKRWNYLVSTLKMCPTFRELQGWDGDPIDF